MLEGDPHRIHSTARGNSNHISSLAYGFLSIVCRLFPAPAEITEQVNTVNGDNSLGQPASPEKSQRNVDLKLLNQLLKSAS